MNRVQSFIARLFRIISASEKRITIIEPHSFRENVIRNKIWYHGDSAELEQFFQKTAKLLLFVSYIQPVCYKTKTKGAEAPSS